MDPAMQSAYTTLALLRLVFLVVCDASFVQACKPPHQADQTEIHRDDQRFIDTTISHIPLLASPLIYGLTLTRIWFEYPHAAELGQRLDLSDVVGALGMLLGSQLRLWCYRVLGRFFTFNLAIRKDHQLVTSGPYAILRHPSYTGILTMSIGLAARYTADNSFLRLFLPSWALSIAFWSSCIGPTYFLAKRISQEEAMLEQEFGDRWKAYRRRTWRLIPLVW